MNILKAKVVMIAAVLGMSLAPRTCEAHEYDLRTGVFEGNWCGLPAQFNIQRKLGNTRKFVGTILIRPTGQIDRIEIMQYNGYRLHIVRHLSGQHSGKQQWMYFYNPQTVLENGRRVLNFRVQGGGGFGANNLGHLNMPPR